MLLLGFGVASKALVLTVMLIYTKPQVLMPVIINLKMLFYSHYSLLSAAKKKNSEDF